MPDSSFNFNSRCENLLARYRRKNAPAVARRLKTLCAFLREDGNHVVQTMFGGSVAKGTYVTGLSDIDVLLIVNDSSLVNQPPAKVKKHVRDAIEQQFPNNSVQAGKLAVTVKYADKTEIQLLPAIRTRPAAFGSPNPAALSGATLRIPKGLRKGSARSTPPGVAG